ncbi:hypothetical protein [Methylicorpusculum sp.]|uniref:hypothetical protein n=1 Tax=Methylicorpusculum sp. TaxID=2713644 RepID=UPI00272C66E8|nr:hypothetical protein [Methylicorpusculum sp.]MDP2204444.1 hypothetical protein [Methylicorpusculum sp.]
MRYFQGYECVFKIAGHPGYHFFIRVSNVWSKHSNSQFEEEKRAGGSVLRMSAAGQIFIPDKICISTLLGGQMLLSSPHGRVYDVPQKAFPSPK